MKIVNEVHYYLALHTIHPLVFNIMKTASIFCCLLLTACVFAQHKEIPLYEGAALGSTTWDGEEKTFFVGTPINAHVIYNVSKPTLTFYKPAITNGASVIICPGGGFRVLNFEREGIHVANELIQKGYSVFVLKYRLVRSYTDNPWQEMFTAMKDSLTFNKDNAAVRNFAIADATAAIKYIRAHASDFNIDPKRVGILGFSAGGALAISLSLSNNIETQPNFAGFIYSHFNPKLYPVVTQTSPPAFIACAADDLLAPSMNSIRIYNAWMEMKRPAELHVYFKGGHGLGATKTASTWVYRFMEWMEDNSFTSIGQ